MRNSHRELFATLGIVISWLTPLVAFFLLLNVPTVRDLVTGFTFVVAIYSTFQLYYWGNKKATINTQSSPLKAADSRTRIQLFVDSLTVSELEDLQRQVQAKLVAHARLEEELQED